MVGDPISPSPKASAAETSASGSTAPRRVLLGELLVESKVITSEQLAEVLGSAREAGKKLGQVLLERGLITEAQLTQTLSLQLSVPWVSLYHIDFSRQLLNRLSREVAEKYCLIPIFVRHVKGQGETLYVAMDDPTNEGALAEVSRLAALPARPMIASASDIRSAIRVYYGESPSSASSIEVPPPPTRIDPPVTAREPRPPPPPASHPESAPHTPVAPTLVDPPRSQPPPPPVPPPRRPQPSVTDEAGPVNPHGPHAPHTPATGAAAAAAAALAGARPSASASSEGQIRVPRAEDSEPARRRPRMIALTLLDGTTINLPAKKEKERTPDALTGRDIVSALRAATHGADATEVLGDQARWEPIVAALLSILLRKGLIADWEFVEELRKI